MESEALERYERTGEIIAGLFTGIRNAIDEASRRADPERVCALVAMLDAAESAVFAGL